MRAIVIGVALSMFIGAGSTAFAAAPSKCDGAITKAEGKKAACLAGVVAKGQATGTAPDTAKTAKCGAKFVKACQKAQTKGDCLAQSSNPADCTGADETEVDGCVAQFSASPSAAFLE